MNVELMTNRVFIFLSTAFLAALGVTVSCIRYELQPDRKLTSEIHH